MANDSASETEARPSEPGAGGKARSGRTLLKGIGIDRAIFVTLLGRVWTSVAGLVSIVFVSRFMTIDEQGYYYTFNSIIGLQVFFELGLSFVILQTASHERAHLDWTPAGTLEGAEIPRARLASLLRLVLNWYGIIALAFIIVVIPVGIRFFTAKAALGSSVAWSVPWVWLVVATGGSLAISPLLAFGEGCGLVSEVAMVRLAQGTAGMLGFWLMLVLRLRLFAVPMISSMALLVGLGWVLLVRRPFFLALVSVRVQGIAIRWWDEVWPFQWRIALSWLSGYFIFQLFTPVLFAFRGPAVAGRMGMSITIAGAVSTIALAWLTTKSPTFGRFAALGELRKLDELFFRSFRQALMVAGFFAVAVFLCVYVMHYKHFGLDRRLLEPLPFALLILATFVQVIVSAEAIYVRAFKEERFLVVSLVSGSLIGLSTYFLGKAFGPIGMMGGYLLVNLTVGLGLGTWVLSRKRKELSAAEGRCA